MLSTNLKMSSEQLNFGGTSLNEEGRISILGMKRTKKLVWNDHIYSVSKKNSARDLKYLLNILSWLLIYKAYIRNTTVLFELASGSNVLILGIIQNWAFKIIGNHNVIWSSPSSEHCRKISCLSTLFF